MGFGDGEIREGGGDAMACERVGGAVVFWSRGSVSDVEL